MRLNYLILGLLLAIKSIAMAESGTTSSTLNLPKPDTSNLVFYELALGADSKIPTLEDWEAGVENRPPPKFKASIYAGSLDFEAKLKPSTIKAIQALPIDRDTSVLKNGPVSKEVISALGYNLDSTISIKRTSKGKVYTIPLKEASSIEFLWGDGNTSRTGSHLRFRFEGSQIECQKDCDSDESSRIAIISKGNPFKGDTLEPIVWKSGSLPLPIKNSALQTLNQDLKESNPANAKLSSKMSIKTYSIGKSEFVIVSEKISKTIEANMYLFKTPDSTWYQLEKSLDTESDYDHHPNPQLIGNFLKDYDQVIVFGRKSSWECGKVILIKGNQVTTQSLICEPSSC